MIPDFQSCMRPLLEPLQVIQIHRFHYAFALVCVFFKPSDEERTEKLPSGKQTIVRNRVGWVRTYLKQAGLISSPGRSQKQITERDQTAL